MPLMPEIIPPRWGAYDLFGPGDDAAVLVALLTLENAGPVTARLAAHGLVCGEPVLRLTPRGRAAAAFARAWALHTQEDKDPCDFDRPFTP